MTVYLGALVFVFMGDQSVHQMFYRKSKGTTWRGGQVERGLANFISRWQRCFSRVLC